MNDTNLPNHTCTGNCDIKYICCYNKCITCGWIDENESQNSNLPAGRQAFKIQKSNSMVIAFNKTLVAPIEAGTKIHTIREDTHNRWRNGIQMHMATGVRTPMYNCFNDQHICTGIQEIFMSYDKSVLHISILEATKKEFGYSELYMPEKEILAYNDGFNSYKLFEEWFVHQCLKRPHNHYAFSAKIIHWTDFRY